MADDISGPKRLKVDLSGQVALVDGDVVVVSLRLQGA